MKRLKMLVSAAIVGVMALSIVGCGLVEKTPEAKEKTVLATVDKEKITKADLDKAMISITDYLKYSLGEDYLSSEEGKSAYLTYAESNLDVLVAQEVLLKKAKEMKFEATDEEVQTMVEETKATYESEEDYQEVLKTLGFTDETVLDYFEEQIIMSKLLDDMFKDIEVSDDEVKAYYDEHKEEFTQNPGANMAHILVADEATAKEVKTKLDNGGDFAALAAEYSSDGSAQSGGELGFVTYENSGMIAEFIDAAKVMGENEISDPVKSQYGYHIIKTTNLVKEATVTPLEDVSSEIKESLLEEKKNALYTENLEKWKKEYNVKTYPEKIEELISEK
ncbi:peptidylprolyl isomerase [Alloiococcus sp. CFN-8]|uniref:peptidylprolyl isomerase n=1 Tax=Alloiococcus sp. CFN-8 TaxID=3416081 RepID=UPI003CE871E7